MVCRLLLDSSHKKYCIILLKYLRVTETSCTFAPRTRRGARVVEEARLESVYTPKGYHEFESRSLRAIFLIVNILVKRLFLNIQNSRFIFYMEAFKPLFQLLDNLLYIYRLQPSVHFFANHHHRSQSAGTYAAQAVQREFPVRGGFADFNAEHPFKFFE